jgi:NAD dependent epimerase/dehydratase family enzyme
VTALEDDRYRGPINAVAPNPARQREFAQTLARVLTRPCEVTMPDEQVRG